MENPWNIQSIYELQHFNCPSCVFKNHSKQEFINHAYEFHSESIDYLKKIADDSLKDVSCPWNVQNKEKVGYVEHLNNPNFDNSYENNCEKSTLDEPTEDENPADNSNFNIQINEIRTVDPFENITRSEESVQNTESENLFNIEVLNNIKTEEFVENPINNCSNTEPESSTKPSNKNLLDTEILKNIKTEEYYFNDHNYDHNEIQKDLLSNESNRINMVKKSVKSQNYEMKDHQDDYEPDYEPEYEMEESNDEEFIDEESNADEYIIDSNEIVYEEVQNDSKCGFCDKTFVCLANLQRHIKEIHSCERCDKVFKQKHDLKNHVKLVHKGEKNHRCDKCGKSFGRIEGLKLHITAVHEGVKNQCKICGKTFNFIESLR